MSDERTGRELTPRPEDALTAREGEQAVTPVAGGEQLGVERFSAGVRAHTVALTEERAAQVVRQSGNARNVAFLAVLLIAVFIPVYWFYDLGIPALGAQGRLEHEKEVQVVTDVARGYALYLANCARCHGPDGKGGIGPPLNDQAKLYDVVQANGQPGKGHLNPTYVSHVLEVGGRYVCGNPNSVMPIWAQPAGPLNYRQIEELIAWITASSDVSFTYTPPTGEVSTGPKPTPYTAHGWRDPNFKPAPGATAVPACWSNPSGQVGGGAVAPVSSAAPIASPGTVAAPRDIKLVLTGTLTITDEHGVPQTSIAVKAGETVRFDVDNQAGFEHNFYIGTADELSQGLTTGLDGIPPFPGGVKTLVWTVPASGSLQFACTLPGHYQTMHGDFIIQP